MVGLPFNFAKEVVETQWLLVPEIKQHEARKTSVGLPRYFWKSKITWLAKMDSCCLILINIDQFMVYRGLLNMLLYMILIKT